MKQLHDINEQVLGGEMNALDAYVQLKRIESLCKQLIAGIKEQAIEEAEKYGEKSFKAYDATIEMRQGGGSWNYKKLSWWDEFEKKKDLSQKAFKSAQAHLTTSDEYGEIVEPAEFKPNANTIAVKL